jgi:transposase
VSGCLRQVDFPDEVAALERALAERALRSPAIRRLMTVPGVNVNTAAALTPSVGRHPALRFAAPSMPR